MKDIRDIPTDRLGSVGKLDSPDMFVQFIRLLPHTPDKVWQAITSTESLADWFPGFRLEHRQGGVFSIWFSGECEGPAHVEGTVEVYDPPNELKCGGMRWQLESVPGGCQLTFTDVLMFQQDHRDDYEITNSVLAGWHYYADRLEDAMAGTLVADDTFEYDYSQIYVPGRAAPLK